MRIPLLRNCLVLVAVVGMMVGTLFFVLTPAKEIAVFQTAKGQYSITRVKCLSGAGIANGRLYVDSPLETGLRRILRKFGQSVAGATIDIATSIPAGPDDHAIAVFCRGKVPNEDFSLLEVHVITEAGQRARCDRRLYGSGFRDTGLFVFCYSDAIKTIQVVDTKKSVPRELVISRRSNQEVLSRLDLRSGNDY